MPTDHNVAQTHLGLRQNRLIVLAVATTYEYTKHFITYPNRNTEIILN